MEYEWALPPINKFLAFHRNKLMLRKPVLLHFNQEFLFLSKSVFLWHMLGLFKRIEALHKEQYILYSEQIKKAVPVSFKTLLLWYGVSWQRSPVYTGLFHISYVCAYWFLYCIDLVLVPSVFILNQQFCLNGSLALTKRKSEWKRTE